jgi:hypothetical protein
VADDMSDCTCNPADKWCNGPECRVHVACDDNCGALCDPQTLDECKAALEHWRSHSCLRGCSHGC